MQDNLSITTIVGEEIWIDWQELVYEFVRVTVATVCTLIIIGGVTLTPMTSGLSAIVATGIILLVMIPKGENEEDNII